MQSDAVYIMDISLKKKLIHSYVDRKYLLTLVLNSINVVNTSKNSL